MTSSWRVLIVAACLLGFSGLVSAQSPTLNPTKSPTKTPTKSPTTAPTLGGYSGILSLFAGYGGVTGIDPSSTVKVDVQLVDGAPQATVYCGAFFTTLDEVESNTKTVPFTSTSDIYKQGYSATTSAAGLASVVVSGMTAASRYNIYCMTVSILNQDIQMPYSVAIQTSTLVTTQCCKLATFSTAITSMFMQTSSLTSNANALTLTLNAAPSASDLKFTFKLYNRDTFSTAVADVGSLSVTTINVPKTYTPGTPYSIVLNAGNPGYYKINVTMSGTGTSGDEYNLVYSGLNVIQVLSDQAEPPAPVLLTSVFSADGTYVAVTFDSPTAGLNSFKCGDLFTFDGSSTATCLWKDSKRAFIYPTYSATSAVLSVTSPITLKDNVVQAYCTDKLTLCTNWVNYAAAKKIYVTAATTSTLPTVVMSGPSTVGPCIPINLDLSNSVGAAGRPWKGYTVTVTAPLPARNLTAIRAFLNSTEYRASVSPPQPIPAEVLAAGYTYTFTARFCNFLGACGTAAKSVAVTNDAATPIVSIIGLNTRTITTWTPLQISVDAYTKSCTGSKSAQNLQYLWTVYEVGASDTVYTAPSVSQNPSTFKLNAYALKVSTTYKVQVTVTSTIGVSPTGVTASVFVVVTPSTIVPVISGGTSRSIQTGTTYVVDASKSYDRDVSGTQTGISFSWSCYQTSPSYNSTCNLAPFKTSAAGALTTSTISVSSATAGTTSRVTVTVYDATRTSSTYMDITVTAAPATVITVGSNLASLTAVNVNQPIQLVGAMTLATPCTAQWSVSGASIDLQSVSPTPVSADYTTAFTGFLSKSMTLLLPGGSLPQRATLGFTLTCGTTKSTISMTTNGAPLPGSFTSDTPTGAEMSATFKFTASLWQDPDLPMSYQFGFISATTSSLLVFQSRSESSFASTKLAAGPVSTNYAVNATLQVFDVYGASAVAQTRVFVTPLTGSAQNSAMADLISSNSGSVDDTNAVIATCSTALNTVNCTAAPNCNTLHRSACAVKPNTCGSCMAGYIGVSGAANVKCLSIAEYNAGGGERRRLTVGGTCLTSSSCNVANWESCVSGKCVQDNKPCPSNSDAVCSGHGTCGWLSKNLLESVDTCGMSDASCKAQCTCATGYAGANCASTTAELEARTKIRSSLIGGLKNVTSIADISEENLISWSTSLNSLALNGDELSISDAQVIHHIANLTVTYAKSMGTQNYASLMGLLTALDTASSIVVEDSRRRRLTGDHRALASAVHADILSTAGAFGDVISNGVAAGQDPNTYIMDNFRMTTQKVSGTSGQIVDIPGPQDDLEYYSGQFAPYFTIEPSATGNDISTSMVLVDSKTFGSAADDMQSNPMQIRMGTDGIKTVKFTLVNKQSNAAFAASVTPAKLTFTCTREIVTQTQTCPGSGTSYSLACTGIAGTVTRDCPRTAPQCSMFDTTSLGFTDSSNKGCKTVGFTENYITCECDIEGRRRLTADIGTVLGATGVTNMVTTSTYIATSFGSTFKASSDFTTPEAAQSVLIVILMFAILWAVGLLSLLGLCFKKQKRIQKTSIEKRRSHKAGSQTHTTADIKRYLLSYVDKLIPDVYHATKSKVERAVDETRKHHRYLQLFTARDDQISPNKRILTLCKMLTVQTMLMFLLAVLYDLQGPDDDGTCGNYTEQGTCTNRKSILDSSQTYCKWTIDENIGLPHCVFQQPVFTVKIMMYIIILTSIFTSIFNTPIDRLFDTLEAPTGESVGQSRLVKGAKAVASGARRASVAAVGAAKAVVAAVPKRMTMFARLTNSNEEEGAQANRRIPEDVTFAHTMAYMALPEISAQAQVAHLRQTVVHNEIRSVAAKRMTQIRGNDKTKSAISNKKNAEVRGAESTTTDVDAVKKTGSEHTVDQFLEEIMQQRLILPSDSEETNQFDVQWGIEKNTSTSADGKTVSTSLFINGHSLRGMSKDVTSSDERAKELKVKMEQCSDNQAGLDILHLFMVDLLGRHTLAAKIFENKFEEDFERTRVVSKYVKWLTLLTIIALNGFFMYYSLLKGFSKGVAWQNKYLQGCIAQLVIEIVLFESIECVWINYWVPDLVSSEVMTAGVILRESAEKISLAEKNQYGQEVEVNTKFFLDAPSYLFVSTKLAKSFPNLLESIIVSSYHNHLPGEISRTWRNERAGGASAENEKVMRNSYAGKRTVGALLFSCIIALSSGLSIMLQALGSLPYFYQRIIIRFVQPVLLSGLTLLWYFAIKNPVYIGIIAAVMIVAGFVLYIRYKNRENNSSRPGKIAPVATGAAKAGNKLDAAPLNQPVKQLPIANSIDKKQYSSVDSSNENAEGRVAPHNPTVGRIDEASSSSGSD